MISSATVESPQLKLADLFLDAYDSSSPMLKQNNTDQGIPKAFDELLNNNIRRSDEAANADSTSENSGLGRPDENRPRRTGVEELQHQVESLGLPLNSLSIKKEDLPVLRKVLEGSGLDTDQVNQVMDKLAQGSLSMDRVMAMVSSQSKQASASLQIGEDTLPYLGRFLQELGLDAEKVKGILNSFKPGQTFNSEALRDILLKNGQGNLKGLNLSQADMQNVQDLLKSLGVSEQNLKNFWGMFKETGGRMSMEGFLGFLKSVDRPARLSREQAANVDHLMKNMLLENSLRTGLQFNRTLALLQSMGDREIDQKFISTNPAIQALRGGASSAREIMQGTGAMGKAGNTGQAGQNDQTASQDFKAAMVSSSAERAAKTGLPSRLSSSVLEQVADKMVYQARNNQNHLRINLNPPDLGRIRISMVLKPSGLQASIVAENQAVKTAIEDQMGQLRSNLEQNGVQLERLDISLSHDDQRADLWDRGQRFDHGGRTGAPESDEQEDFTEQKEPGRRPRGTVDLVA